MSAKHSQGNYTQLPQSISDSDTDTEVNDDLKEIKHTDGPRKLIQNGCTNGFTLPSHVVVKHSTGFAALSTQRKVAFILSCLLCVVVVVVFVWILPCSNSGICPTHIGSWKIEHEGIEFHGRINVIPGAYRRSSTNLALLARKSFNNADTRSGAVGLKTSNGRIEWFVSQVSTPNEMNCDEIDANEDGVKDCLLWGETGLVAVEPLAGSILWYAHNTKMVISHLDHPLVLPDLNKDNVNEVMSVTDWHQQHNKLILISGRTGKLLTSIILHMCDIIEDYKYDEKRVLFNCKNASHDNYYKIAIGDLQKKIANGTFPVQATRVEYKPIASHPYILHGRQVTVVNKGVCPACTADVELLDVNGERPIRLMGWNGLRTYAMKPIAYQFKPTKANTAFYQGYLNGFIMKIWHWSEENRFMNVTSIRRSNLTEKVILISFADDDLKVLNVSFVQITQLCFPHHRECQPTLAHRNESILVADLDQDGSLEVINYSTTYKCDTDDDKSCNLVSHIQVIQLEAEMMQLFAKN